MRVTTKGQVTIPVDLREKFGLYPLTEVEFRESGDQLVIQKASEQDRGKRLVEKLRGRGQVKMTTDEIMALTRGE